MSILITDLSFKDLSPGDFLRTKRGFLWEKLKEDCWRDVFNGTIWLPEKEGSHTHYQALHLVEDKEILPTKEEFEQAELHGIREVLDMVDRNYWSSTTKSDDYEYAYVFGGLLGGDFLGLRNQLKASVMCIRSYNKK